MHKLVPIGGVGLRCEDLGRITLDLGCMFCLFLSFDMSHSKPLFRSAAGYVLTAHLLRM